MAQKDASDVNTGNFLFKNAKAMAGVFAEILPAALGGGFTRFADTAPSITDDAWGRMCDKWVERGWIDKEMRDFVYTIKDQPKLYRIIGQLIIPLLLYVKSFSDTIGILGMKDQYNRMAKATPSPAPIDNLVKSMMLDPNRSTENRAELKKYGFNDTQIDNIILSYYRLYDEGTIRTAYLRGIISETMMYERMRELGYTDTRTKEIVQTWELLPPPSDLFTMVAHEAFEPDIYKKLGLDAEFPVEQVEWLKKQGISEDWARKYWIAHWDEPSIGQGFEMLHRGVIDMEELDILFKTVEIPEYWRSKLTAIAYQPYTRVDVRRMHEMGVLTDEELIKSYMDLGYDPEKALKMAEFTIRYNAESQQQLTRATILESYRENLISKRDAKALLMSQDYSDDLAEYYLTLEDYNREKELQKVRIDNLKEQYLLGLNTESQTRAELNKMGLLGEKIEVLLEQWAIQLYKYQRLPTKSDLDTFLILGIIKQNDYEMLMMQAGFSWAHVQHYLKLLEGERYQAGRAPTKSELTNWFKNGLIDETQYRQELKAMGYADKYIELYINSL